MKHSRHLRGTLMPLDFAGNIGLRQGNTALEVSNWITPGERWPKLAYNAAHCE